MLANITRLVALAGQVLLVSLSVQAQALQPATSTTDSYSVMAEEFETEFYNIRDNVNILAAEWNDTAQRFKQNTDSVRTLLNDRSIGLMQAMLTEMVGDVVASQLVDAQSQFRPGDTLTALRGSVFDWRAAPGSQQDRRELKLTLGQNLNAVDYRANLTVIEDMRNNAKRLLAVRAKMSEIEHELKATNAAADLAVQRNLSIIQELQRIHAENLKWQQSTYELFDQYWNWADIEGTRCEQELETALTVLKRSSQDNLGAAFAEAVTLLRLERHNDATPLINDLAKLPQVMPLALALRAEMHIRSNDRRGYMADMKQCLQLSKDDYRVRVHRAQAYMAAKEYDLSSREWELALKTGKCDLSAYRGIALANASKPHQSPKSRKQAMQYGTIAAELASDDWSCQIALALAEIANGNTDGGLASVKDAADLALGSNRTYCEQLIEKISNGAPVTWRF